MYNQRSSPVMICAPVQSRLRGTWHVCVLPAAQSANRPGRNYMKQFCLLCSRRNRWHGGDGVEPSGAKSLVSTFPLELFHVEASSVANTHASPNSDHGQKWLQVHTSLSQHSKLHLQLEPAFELVQKRHKSGRAPQPPGYRPLHPQTVTGAGIFGRGFKQQQHCSSIASLTLPTLRYTTLNHGHATTTKTYQQLPASERQHQSISARNSGKTFFVTPKSLPAPPT